MKSSAKAKVMGELFFNRSLAPAIFLALLSVVMSGCGGGNNDKDVTSQGQVTITGVVKGSGGLVDVEVSSGSKSTLTDANGFYALSNIPIPTGGSIVLTYEKDGYATFQRSLPVANGETYAVAASMLQYHHREESMDTAQNNHLIIADNNSSHSLAEISFPAGSVASNGNVTVEVAVGDPTTEAGRPTFPGNYMAASTLGGEADTPLESVVFTEITITDANGVELTQLNEPATVTLRLPEALQQQYVVGGTIPWWSYDETTATWVREDAKPATERLDDADIIDLNGDGILYAQAEVTHFSWWNVDLPMNEHACLCVTVQDENDAPVAGSLLFAEGVSYNGISNPARTDMNGRACVTVKRSTGTTAERVKLYVESGSIRFHYDVTNAREGDVTSNEVFTPTTQGSTILNTGQCVDLENTLEQYYDGIVSGTVTKEGSGAPVAGFTISSNFGPTAITDTAGRYSMNVPVGVPISLFSAALISREVTVNSADTPAIADFIIPLRAPVISQITRAPDGVVTSGQAVTLNVTATDPDGDTLTYAWETTAGNLNQTAGTTVVWTSPATSSGTAHITVTVTDTDGKQTQQTVPIIYNEVTQTGDRLAFVIKDRLSSDQPVQGVTIALYNTDNRTILQTRISDASGVVDFGDIGRGRATITIVYENIFEGEREIDTYINVSVAENIVYYLDDDSFNLNTTPRDTIANINLTLSNVPSSAVQTNIQPLVAYQNIAGAERLSNIPVGGAHLQDDGQLSMLALTYSDANFANIAGYGFLLDQPVLNGALYDISLDRSPLGLGWETTPAGALLSELWILGDRGGRGYSLSSSGFSGGQAAASGVVPFANEFPVDHYFVLATYSGSTELQSHVRYDTLPQSINVPIPDYSIDNFNYAEPTQTLSWEITGSTPRDSVSLTLLGEDLISWTVLMSEDATSWQVIDLPEPANTWLNIDNIMFDTDEVSISVCDLDSVSGMDELWEFVTSGESVYEAIQYAYCGERELSIVTDATDMTKSSAAPPVEFDLPIKSLGHLHRR